MNNKPAHQRNILRLILDVVLFAVLLLSLDRQLTGKPLHEWLPIAGIAAILLHLLLSWEWIAAVTRRLFARGAIKQKLNYILNWLLFVDWILVTLSGIVVSRVVLPALGIHLKVSAGWHWLHGQTASLLLVILALHLALNWAWVVNMVKRIFHPRGSLRHERQVAASVVEESQS